MLLGVGFGGLSPLARGGLPHSQGRNNKARVIPACAGYPRLRGLSPLARGGQGHRVRDDSWGRVIPACAGWTLCELLTNQHITGYPRLRGVDGKFPRAKTTQFGLSPLARGGRRLLPADYRRCRVIPACAGWTPQCYRSHPGRTGYPRLRGVDADTTW